MFILTTDPNKPRSPFHQIHIALTSDIPIAIQFGGSDEREFRVALNSSGGRERIAAALTKIDAQHAQSSVETDREFILAVVKRDMGLAQFNALIRDGIKLEYSNISKAHGFK